MTCAENVQRKNTKQAQNKYVSYISGLCTLDSTVGYSGKTTIVRVYDDNFEKKNDDITRICGIYGGIVNKISVGVS